MNKTEKIQQQPQQPWNNDNKKSFNICMSRKENKQK